MDKANAVEIDDPQKAPEPDRDKQEAAEKLVANSAWTLCNKGKALLEGLVITSSGNDERTYPIGIESAGFIYRTLVPLSSWM
ncbi:hypothetical protein MUK42_35625 [Musa troglodytarum]|uniref:Uncharacterized protein n=1 Tax=Musa troglodytarum TaxID=320322 RepID=A0A9E7G592_9LILI|nr:hypothetical protein MUK42_35625 [Musa troglodytarum]